MDMAIVAVVTVGAGALLGAALYGLASLVVRRLG